MSHTETAREDLKLGEIWAGTVRNRWLILGCMLLAGAGAVYYTARSTPIYEAFATIRVQERELNLREVYHTVSTGIAGSDLGTEMEVLRSRALREDAAHKLALQVQVRVPARVSRQEIIGNITVTPDAEPAVFSSPEWPTAGSRCTQGTAAVRSE